MKNSENKEELLLKMLKAKKISQPDIINFLKTNNLDLNKIDSHGYNLLHHAIKLDHAEIVNLFLNLDDNQQTLKADPNIQTMDNTNSIFLHPIMLALIHCNDTTTSNKIIKSLLRAGAESTIKDEDGCNLVHKACEKGRIDVLEILENKSTEENPINWNETCKNGSALHMAICGDQEDIVVYLLDKKMDFNSRDQNHNTALHLALQLKNFNVFKLMLDHIKNSTILLDDDKKAITSSVNDEDNTILHELAYNQSSVLTDYVVRNNNVFGINLDLKNKENYNYLEVQKNIIQIKKDKEIMEKQKRDFMRQEKERITNEIKKQAELQRKMEQDEIDEEEKVQEFRNKILGYRNYIFFGLFLVFLMVLYLIIYSKVNTKKQSVVI